MSMDNISSFCDAMKGFGLDAPTNMIPEKIYRFPGMGKDKKNQSGWCVLFQDGQGGSFGDWSSDLNEVWQAKRETSWTLQEKEIFTNKIKETKRRLENEKQIEFKESAIKSQEVWNKSIEVNEDYPYLRNKRIKPFGAKLYNGSLVVPLYFNDSLHSLQFIAPDGGKHFLSGGRVSGCSFLMGDIQEEKSLCIVEGFATGATIHEATGLPVVVSFNAGNLETVAQEMRKKYPKKEMIICADDDHMNEKNIGITKATSATLATRAKLAIPNFGNKKSKDTTDFNDMAKIFGLELVALAIKNATFVWPASSPLITKSEPENYPLQSLPITIREAVEEVCNFTKAPFAMVAASAISAISLAIQAHVDVKRAENLLGPCSLFMLTVADSGERKSTCDTFFLKSIRDYEAKVMEEKKSEISEYRAQHHAWESKIKGVKNKITSQAMKGHSTFDLESKLRTLEKEKPIQINYKPICSDFYNSLMRQVLPELCI